MPTPLPESVPDGPASPGFDAPDDVWPIADPLMPAPVDGLPLDVPALAPDRAADVALPLALGAPLPLDAPVLPAPVGVPVVAAEQPDAAIARTTIALVQFTYFDLGTQCEFVEGSRDCDHGIAFAPRARRAGPGSGRGSRGSRGKLWAQRPMTSGRRRLL
jgi:hypothetical protein